MNDEITPIPDEVSENERLKAALCEIRRHVKEIDALLDSVAELLDKEASSPDAPASKEEIKDLLRKYSRL